jgi:hypothetical protein
MNKNEFKYNFYIYYFVMIIELEVQGPLKCETCEWMDGCVVLVVTNAMILIAVAEVVDMIISWLFLSIFIILFLEIVLLLLCPPKTFTPS